MHVRAWLSAAIAALLSSSQWGVDPAQAAQRTFVSTSGSDSSAICAVSAPCRTFAKAITVTDDAGEVIAVESGGYGATAVNRSVSIIAPPGVYAGISVFSGSGGRGSISRHPTRGWSSPTLLPVLLAPQVAATLGVGDLAAASCAGNSSCEPEAAQCTSPSDKKIEVTEAADVDIPANEGKVATFSPAYWQPQFASEVAP